jgi:hypothetical protein
LNDFDDAFTPEQIDAARTIVGHMLSGLGDQTDPAWEDGLDEVIRLFRNAPMLGLAGVNIVMGQLTLFIRMNLGVEPEVPLRLIAGRLANV